MKNKKTSVVSLRLPDDVKERLRVRAEMSSRTMSNLILCYVNFGLDADKELLNETPIRREKQG